jgi:hypothetical protein
MRQPSPAARTAFLALAALLVATACAGFPNPLQTPVPRDGLHPNDPVQPVQPPPAVPADPAKVDELQRHRAVWEGVRIRDYSMTVIYGCVCVLAGRPIKMTVAGGQLVSATDDGEAIDLDQLTGFPATVDALFDYAARNANAGKIEFAWDERIGIPTAVGVDPDLETFDDEIRIGILDFSPRP